MEKIKPQIEVKKYGEPKKIGEILKELDRVSEFVVGDDLVDKYGSDKIKSLRREIEFFFQENSIGFAGFFSNPLNITDKEKLEIANKLSEFRLKNEDLLPLYKDILSVIRKTEEGLVRKELEEFKDSLTIDSHKRFFLDEITVSMRGEITEEQKDLMRGADIFRSGNFLIHLTSVKKALLILKTGAILTADELFEKTRTNWSRGGNVSISFNMNDVRVLTGDPSHFMGFVTSPEAVLDEDNLIKINNNQGAKFEVLVSARPGKQLFPSVPINKTMIFVSERDEAIIKDIIAGLEGTPKAILVYPNISLRTVSWLDPIGDHEVAGEMLRKLMSDSGLPSPSISWESDLFPSKPVINDDTYVETNSDYYIVKEDGELVVKKPEQKEGLVG